MPPRAGSRYRFCNGLLDVDDQLFLTDREPYRFCDFPDNRIHLVVEGDTLFHLAGRYFSPLPRACGYWWVIADFQPDPIFDPTLKLDLGRRIYVPSVRVLTDVILSAAIRRSRG